jgi:hypothetical protein
MHAWKEMGALDRVWTGGGRERQTDIHACANTDADKAIQKREC